MLSERDLNATNIPVRVFLYTLDQLSLMLAIPEKDLMNHHIFTERHSGFKPAWKMKAVNVAAPDQAPQWRVADKELIRWLKYKGFRVIERGYVRD